MIRSCAVTVTVMRFTPMLSVQIRDGADGAGGAPLQPLYITSAFGSLFVGVIMTLAVARGTLAA